MKKFGIIGAGVVGTALGIALCERGWELCGIFDSLPTASQNLAERTGGPVLHRAAEVAAKTELLFITTNDSNIEKIAEQLKAEAAFQPEQVIVHMSGAQTSESLAGARAFGARVLSVHPLQSFANPEMAMQNLPGSMFSIEGESEAYDVAVDLVETLGGEYFFIDQRSKPLYHAGACVVSNYLVTLVDFGVRLLESTGIPRELAIKALSPLINGTISNLDKVGIAKALTGPIARGDYSTITKHLNCLAEQAPELLPLYSHLGMETIRIAISKGSIGEAEIAILQKLFNQELNSMSNTN